MSTVVDQRVVEMRFDNKQFEQGVSSTMSMLDKLKQSLNFKGLSKSATNCGTSFKEVESMACSAGFSLRDVWLKTSTVFEYQVARKIVNSAKNMAKALTITPISTGFKEYETQMNAVQTILANTKSKGSTLDDVNKALDELNTYADKTIYNFTEMTRNIGTFTAAGIDLETSVSAIQGIANLAAVSGSTSQQASTAMYQLSQALAAGTIRLMDWNSVVNAGMGGEVFQNALKETSKELGTGAEAAIKASGSFRESLRDGWLTSEVLTETLKKFTSSGANEYVAKYTGLSKEAVSAALKEAEARYGEADAIEHASKALAEKSGKNQKEIKEALEFAKTAEDAATKVKTFSQLWEVLQESAQSGWAQTWKLIVGDFEQAKSILTPLADLLTGIINKFSKARNDLLAGALGKGFGALSKKINALLKPAVGAVDTVKEVGKAVSNLGEIVDKVIIGKFGNGKERFDALSKAGYNFYEVQNKVNEKLGNAHRYTKEQIEAQDKLLGVQKEATEAQGKLSDSEAERIAKLTELSDAQLHELGLTWEQIQAVKELKKTSEKLGIPVEKLIENIDQINGRWLMIESFKNIGKGLIDVFKAVAEAWKGVFPPKTLEERTQQLFDLLAGAHKLTTSLVDVIYQNGKLTDTGDKLVRTLKGVFSILDIILTVVGGPLKIAFKLFVQLLEAFDLDILDVTASIGDAIVKFRDWIDATLDFTKVFEKIAPPIKNAVKAVRDWIASLKDSEDIPGDIARAIGTGLGKAVLFVGNLIKDMVAYVAGGFKDIPGFITSGFVGGIWEGIKSAAAAIIEFAKTIISSFCAVLGIASPSRVFHELGVFTIEGLLGGLKEGASAVWEFIKTLGSKLIEFFKNIDFGTLFAGGLGVGMLISVIKIGNALENITEPFGEFGEVLEGLGKAFKSFALNMKAKAIKNIATAIAILVGSIVVLTLIPTDKLWSAIGAIAALAVIIGLLSVAVGKFGASGNVLEVGKISALLLSLSVALLLMAAVLKILGSLSADEAGVAIAAFTALITGMLVAVATLQLLSRGARSLPRATSALTKMAGAMLIMAVVIKLMSGMDDGDLAKGLICIGAFVGILAVLTAITKLGGSATDKVGATLIKMAAAMLLMVFVTKCISGLSIGEIAKGIITMAAFGALIAGFIWMTKLMNTGADVKSIGSVLFKIAGAMLLMSIVVRMVAGLSLGEIIKGVGCIAAFAGIITGLIAATKLAGPGELKRLGSTLLMVSISIGILAGVAMLLGLVNLGSLAKGVAAVILLGGIMTAMIWATRGAEACKGNIIAMTAAITLMTIAVIALSSLDSGKLAAATLALSFIMGMFALMTFVAGAAKTTGMALGTIVVLTIVVAAMAALLWKLSELPVESSIGAAASLSILLLSVTAALGILSNCRMTIGDALVSILALTGMAIPLYLFVEILRSMDGVENAKTNVLALSTLISVLTIALIPLTIIGSFVASALFGVLALTAMAIPLLAFVGVLALMQNIQNATENAALLTALMRAMTTMLIQVAMVAPLAILGVAAMAALTGLIVAVGALAIGVGALMEKFPQLEEFLDRGIPILEKIAYAIGSFVGNLVSGFMNGVADGLPQIAAQLSTFMMLLTPFIAGAKMIDDSVMTGVGTLAKAIIALTAADLVAGMASFGEQGSSFAKLGAELSLFMLNAMPFIIGAAMIKPEMMEAVKTLAETIMILTAADLLDGLKLFGGDSSLATFGAELAAFGPYMKTYADSVAGIDAKAVTASATAAKALAEMAAVIPNIGGLVSAFTGDNSLASFGTQLVPFGIQLKLYSLAVAGINSEAIEISVTAANSLSEMASSVPNMGGLVSFFTGDNDLAAFGAQLMSFGMSLKTYSIVVAGLNSEAIEISVTAANSLSEMASAIPNMGGLVSFFTGDNDLATFGAQIMSFGVSLKAYSMTVTGLNLPAIALSVAAATLLSELEGSLCKTGGVVSWFSGDNGLDTFGTNLKSFGKSLKKYSEHVSGMNSSAVAASVEQVQKLADLADTLEDVDGDSIASFSKSLGKIGKDGVNKFVEAFTDAGTKATKAVNSLISDVASAIEKKYSKFTSAGEKVMKKFGSGITKSKSSVQKSATTLMTQMLSAIKGKYQGFYSAGSYLVDGFIAGIGSKIQSAANKAAAMANAAEKAAKNALAINSPSKVFREIGMGVPEGFAQGIGKLGSVVSASTVGMADVAVDSIRNSIANIANMVNSDIDAQPTIRPVLDLSSVRAGANSISGILGTGSSVGVLARVGAINSSMNAYGQNGTNDDIISAINKLGEDLANVGGNTTNINGITYDDGSNITSAVEAIVRAARMGRRT